MNKHQRRLRSAKAIADICDGAFDVLDSEGWLRGDEAIVATEGGCMATAMARVARERSLGFAFTSAVTAVSRHVGDSIVAFNDRQRSVGPVLAALEHVADAHRAFVEGAASWKSISEGDLT